MRQCNLAPRVQNSLELVVWNITDVKLHETFLKALLSTFLPPYTAPGWILRRKQHEMRVRSNGLLKFGHEEFPIIIQQPIERFENIRGR